VVDVSLHPGAEAEYESALAWYLERSARAAAGFEAAVDRAIGFIATFPEASPLCDDGTGIIPSDVTHTESSTASTAMKCASSPLPTTDNSRGFGSVGSNQTNSP
jgi:hypothetical protein